MALAIDLSSASAIGDFLASPAQRLRREVVHTLFRGPVVLPHDHCELARVWSGQQIVQHLCEAGIVSIEDIMLISGGKELCAENIVRPVDTPVYALLRPNARGSAQVFVHDQRTGRRSKHQLDHKMRVRDLRHALHKSCATGLAPGKQRLVCEGRQLSNHGLLGDYWLHRRRARAPMIHVYATIDPTADACIRLHLPNRQVLKFTVRVGDPIACVRRVLHTSFRMPLELPLDLYATVGGVHTMLSQYQTLLDYGLSGDKHVDMYLGLGQGMLSNAFTFVHPPVPRLPPPHSESKREPQFAGLRRGFLATRRTEPAAAAPSTKPKDANGHKQSHNQPQSDR